MNESQRLAIAAHLHVLLRRKLGRVTDTEWMACNLEYGRAIVRLCREQDDAELADWAGRLELALKPLALPPPPPPPAPAPRADDPRTARERLEQRYIGRLR